MNTDNNLDADVHRQKMEWARQSWSIPDLRGGKQKWFLLVKELINLIHNGQANDLDAIPELETVPTESCQTWHSYIPFLREVGLVVNQDGKPQLSEDGFRFYNEPTHRVLADFIQGKFRLFGEALNLISIMPSTVEDINETLCKEYNIEWQTLTNIRKRMDWLEVLGLIQGIEERKWEITEEGNNALADWILVSPNTLNIDNINIDDIVIPNPPPEISELLQRLVDNPELHKKRSTYNIWVPSPNRISNLKIIVHYATDRISKDDLFELIKERFSLKTSSVESMLPFLKISGLIKEVGRNIYCATPAAKAWLETDNDLDLIRILHANMQFVGEMILAAENDVTRNYLYEQASLYGLNNEKARWIAGFLLEAGLLEETQYLHLKATPFGLSFAATLPLAEKSEERDVDSEVEETDNTLDLSKSNFYRITNSLQNASTDPNAEGKTPGLAFEQAIADIFKYMGFDTERIGGSGNTDVVVRWKDDERKVHTAIIDGKSKSNGQVSHSDISDVAIEAHKEKNNAEYVAIVGARFSGDTIKEYARKKEFALISVDRLIEIAYESEQIGLSLQEISLVFKVPNGISQLEELISSKHRIYDITSKVIDEFNKEQELDELAPRDLYLLLRNTNLSPSLEELLNVFELLSGNGIDLLHPVDTNNSPERITYQLGEAKKTANDLRALANAIESGIYNQN